VRPDENRRVYEVADCRAVARWLASAAADPVTEGASAETRATYLDTADWRFHRAGLTLCIRSGGGGIEAISAPLDAAPGAGAALPAASAPLAEARVDRLADSPGIVGQRVRALAGTNSLVPVVELLSCAREFAVGPRGATLATLTLDETTVPLPGEEQPLRIARVEIAGDFGEERGRAWLAALEAACDLHPVRTSLYQAALRAIGLGPPPLPVLGPTEVDHRASVLDVARAVLRKQLLAVMAHEAGTRLGEDVEQLHDMRVATRRIRAALRLFRDHVPERVFRLRQGFGWLGRALGEVRDLDVHLARLEEWRQELDDADGTAMQPIVDRLRRAREIARRRLLRVLDSRRYARLLARAGREVRPRSRPRAAVPTPIVDAAPDLIARRYRRVLEAGDRLTPLSPSADWHAMRIRCKALRYALEFHLPVYGAALREVIRPLVKLQDLLGQHQDCRVAADWLRRLVSERVRSLPRPTLFVAGTLSGRYEYAERSLRRDFRRRYAKLKGKRRRRLEECMRRLRPPTQAIALPPRRS